MTHPPAPEMETQAAFWAAGLREGRVVPFLGPGVLDTGATPAPFPTTPTALALALNAKVTVPGRVRGNLWSSAQFIETRRHRQTLDRLLREIFAPPPTPLPFHHWLASLSLPLIVDAWYDASLSAALRAHTTDWGQVQGANRQALRAEEFFVAFTPAGDRTAHQNWSTALYKPHGSIWPVANLLVSDSDYVEALTEIDIQTPIPPVVQERRATRGFLFLGSRFDDQTTRMYARQIMKRSQGPHAAVMSLPLTRHEERFLEEQNITLLPYALKDFVATLMV